VTGARGTLRFRGTPVESKKMACVNDVRSRCSFAVCRFGFNRFPVFFNEFAARRFVGDHTNDKNSLPDVRIVLMYEFPFF